MNLFKMILNFLKINWYMNLMKQIAAFENSQLHLEWFKNFLLTFYKYFTYKFHMIILLERQIFSSTSYLIPSWTILASLLLLLLLLRCLISLPVIINDGVRSSSLKLVAQMTFISLFWGSMHLGCGLFLFDSILCASIIIVFLNSGRMPLLSWS